jgi:selenocysteine-specific elongation factor
MRVIGTAGHIDHGKSTLVKRLTGIDPDRLAEEKARQMTIDLGFAWLELPGGEIVGIVDVPGHRDFIDNMLAGVGGIDAVLLVIAADAGVMPQTREHLAILDLLGIERGLVALTKTDLVDDPEWLELVEHDIHDLLQSTSLADVEIIPVSAFSGDGLPELVEKLGEQLAEAPPHPDTNQPRLPVDRVFTISGFGTVITGTLQAGALHTGDEVEFLPGGLRGRIRGLQSYKQQVTTAYPGSRVAVNISGVNKDEIARGAVLIRPGQLKPTLLADVHFRHLPDASRPLKHNTQVKIFAGTAEATAHVRLLDSDQLAPGDEGWLQLRLDRRLPLAHGDRYIMRYPSPPETIGGGIVVNPHPGRRWKRFQPQVIAGLETRMQGTPEQRVAQAAEGIEPVTAEELRQRSGYNPADFERAVQAALDGNLIVHLPDNRYLAATSYNHLLRQMDETVQSFHRSAPLRVGIPREELRSRLGIKNTLLPILLSGQPEIIAENNLIRRRDHQVRFSERQQARIDEFTSQLEAAPYTPPSYSEAAAHVGEDVLRALIEQGQIVQVQPEVIFSRAAYDEMVAGTLALIDENGSVDARALRDAFNTSRKYAIGLLEHLDSAGITRRTGDVRVRGTTIKS